jgi:hypothetical protein
MRYFSVVDAAVRRIKYNGEVWHAQAKKVKLPQDCGGCSVL